MIILIAAIALMMYLLEKHYHRWENRPRTNPIALTRSALFYIAVWPSIRKLVISAILSSAVVLFLFRWDRLDRRAAIACAILFCFQLLLFNIPDILRQYLPLRPLLHMPDFSNLFSQCALAWNQNAWQFITEKWFIHINRTQSIALHSADIDFSWPAWLETEYLLPARGTYRIPTIPSLRRKCGKTCHIHAPMFPDLESWIYKHGGSLNWKEPPPPPEPPVKYRRRRNKRRS